MIFPMATNAYSTSTLQNTHRILHRGNIPPITDQPTAILKPLKLWTGPAIAEGEQRTTFLIEGDQWQLFEAERRLHLLQRFQKLRADFKRAVLNLLQLRITTRRHHRQG